MIYRLGHPVRTAATLLAAFLLLPTGCRSTSPAEPFADVRMEVASRTPHDIIWNRLDAGADEIDSAVADLLSRELTADSAAQVALLNNRRLQATYARLGLAQADLIQAGLLENPIFSGVFRWAPGKQHVFDFSVVQDFLDILLRRLEMELAKTELEAAKAEVVAEVIDVAATAKRAFYDYVANEQRIALWEATLLAMKSSYEMAQALRQAGNIPEVDLLNEQATYERVKLELARDQARRVHFRERLNRLMGLWRRVDAWTAVAALPPIPESEWDDAAIEQRALAASLDLKNAYLEVEAAAKQFRVAEVMEVLPRFDLGLGMELEKEESVELVEHKRRSGSKYELREVPGPTEIWSGPEISIAIPIFDQGQAARAAGRAEIERRFERYTALAIETRSAARELAFRAANARQRAIFHRDVFVPLRQTITEETQLRYNAMFDGVFRLLHAKEREIEAQRQYIEALRDYWRAQADLEQLTMGSLPAEFREGLEERDNGGQPRRWMNAGRSFDDARAARDNE